MPSLKEISSTLGFMTVLAIGLLTMEPGSWWLLLHSAGGSFTGNF
jgi:hypothetical protein